MEWNKMVIQCKRQTRILNIVLIVAMLWFFGAEEGFFFYSLTVFAVAENNNSNSNHLFILHFLCQRSFFPSSEYTSPGPLLQTAIA